MPPEMPIAENKPRVSAAGAALVPHREAAASSPVLRKARRFIVEIMSAGVSC
jgi:hypothetical protein